VKKLAANIEKLKAELSTSTTGSKLTTTSTGKSGSQFTGSKVTGLTLIRPTKLVRKPSVSSSDVSPSVTSSTADVTGAGDKPTEASSPLDQVMKTCYIQNLSVHAFYLLIFKTVVTLIKDFIWGPDHSRRAIQRS